MKKFLLAALALIGMSSSAMAFDNEPEEGFSTQIIGGLTISNITGVDANDLSAKVGGTLGGKLEYMLPGAHGTYVNAGLNWKMKGAKASVSTITDGHGTVDGSLKYKLHYLELPIHVGFRYNIDDKLGLYGEFGPYFAIGINGRAKVNIDADGSWVENFETSYNVFKSDNSNLTFQRWDAGIGFRIGAEYAHHYSINLGCDWGITDMYRDSYRDAVYDAIEASGVKNYKLNKVHNLCFDITFGYRF